MSELILYSTDCPRCKVLEKKLSDKGIEFKKVTEFDENYFLTRGFTTVPIIEIPDGGYLGFKDAVDYINKI